MEEPAWITLARIWDLIGDASPGEARRRADPKGTEEKRAAAVRALLALGRDQAVQSPELEAWHRVFWRHLRMADDPHATLGALLGIGRGRRGPKRKDDTAFALAVAVVEKMRDGLSYDKATAAVAEENNKSVERIKAVHSKHLVSAKAEVALCRSKRELTNMRPDGWITRPLTEDDHRASDDGMPEPSPNPPSREETLEIYRSELRENGIDDVNAEILVAGLLEILEKKQTT